MLLLLATVCYTYVGKKPQLRGGLVYGAGGRNDTENQETLSGSAMNIIIGLRTDIISSANSTSSSASSTATASSTTALPTPVATGTLTSNTSIICPTANRTLYSDPSWTMGQKFLLLCGRDYNSNGGAVDITSMNITTFAGCLSECGNTEGCMAVGWGTYYGVNTCWLKSAIGVPNVSGSWYAAVQDNNG